LAIKNPAGAGFFVFSGELNYLATGA